MSTLPKHWSRSPSSLMVVCDLCQQCLAFGALERGHTLAHHADGRWATAPGESDLCPSSPGYRPASPLESGVRELIINTAGVSVPVRVGDVSRGEAMARGTERSHDWVFVGGPPALADLHNLVANFLASTGHAPKCIEVSADDHRRLSADCVAMQPSAAATPAQLADAYSQLDRDQRADFRRRTCLLLTATSAGNPVDLEHFTTEALEAEVARREPDWVAGTMRIGKGFLEQLHRLMEPRGAYSDVELKERVDGLLAREKPPPMRVGLAGCTCRECEQASTLLMKHAEPQHIGRNDVTFEPWAPKRDSITLRGATFVAPEMHAGCAVCGAPRGEPCTSSCEDAVTPDAMVVSWGPEHSRDAREGLRYEGLPVSQLPPPKPPTRPDNSVAHLDVDLLADDA